MVTKDILPNSLRQAIQQCGKTILLDDARLLNILNDLHAYSEYDCTQPVVKSIINKGYAKQLHAVAKLWSSNKKIQDIKDAACKDLANPTELTAYVFDCFLYGLGKTNVMPQYVVAQTNKSGKRTASQKTNISSYQIKNMRGWFKSLVATSNSNNSVLAKISLIIDIIFSLAFSTLIVSSILFAIQQDWEFALELATFATLTILIYTLGCYRYFEKRLGRH